MFTELIQEMDTLAAPENTDLLSRGGSAPVELVDSSTEDEELGQERKEVEVVVVNSTEPSITAPGEDTTCKEASSLWPAGQVRPNNMYDKVVYDPAFKGVPTDVRTKEKVKPLPIVRFSRKDWDRKRKEKSQKERKTNGKGYVIPKHGSTSASPGVGSTPTPSPLPAPAADVSTTTKDIIKRASKDILMKAGNITASTASNVSIVGSTPTPSVVKETGARKKDMKLLEQDHPPLIILPDMTRPPPVISRSIDINIVNVPNYAPPAIKSPHPSLTAASVTNATNVAPSSSTSEVAIAPTGATSASGRKVLLPTPSHEEIAASRGFGGGSYGKPQANQQNLPRTWEDLWWCHRMGCGESNWVQTTTCARCGAPRRFNPLYHVVSGLKRKLEYANNRIAELESESKQRKT